jgi:hypothetical protein
VNQPFGPQPISVQFAGNSFYLPSNTAASLFVPQPPSITKVFTYPLIELFFGSTPLSFAITNPNPIPLAGIAFSDTLPSLVTIATPDNGLTGSCGGGTIIAAPGSSLISLTGAMLGSGASCTFSVLVNGVDIGMKTNLTSAVTSTTGKGLSGAPAAADITVVFSEFYSFFGEGGGSSHH